MPLMTLLDRNSVEGFLVLGCSFRASIFWDFAYSRILYLLFCMFVSHVAFSSSPVLDAKLFFFLLFVSRFPNTFHQGHMSLSLFPALLQLVGSIQTSFHLFKGLFFFASGLPTLPSVFFLTIRSPLNLLPLSTHFSPSLVLLSCSVPHIIHNP